ncbi:MAG: hypothetical protein ACFCD0_19950 [Gemmataceae bacterium]
MLRHWTGRLWTLVILLVIPTANVACAEELVWEAVGKPGKLSNPESSRQISMAHLLRPEPMSSSPDLQRNRPDQDFDEPFAEKRIDERIRFAPTRPIVRGQDPGTEAVPPLPPPPLPPGPSPIDPNEDLYCGTCYGKKSGPTGFFAGAPGYLSSVFVPDGERGLFQSDHEFDGFMSPLSNPFLFEDPRALTEIRPIFMYQRTPSDNPIYAGGNVTFFGLQARVAITPYVSIVMNKLGWIWQEVNNPDPFVTGLVSADGQFGEIHVGPKFTFLRYPETQTLLAAGLTFQIPSGATSVAQSTGSLSLVPYVSYGQQFLQSDYGAFHFIGTTGYAFGTDDQRTDYWFLSAHFDYDILNYHRFYPFIDLNYFLYTSNGGSRPIDFEGRALQNFGATNVSGDSDLSIATGMRFKFNPFISIGAGVEFALLSPRDMFDYRILVDMIFRY